MNSLIALASGFLMTIEPWKGVIASVAGALGAALGILGGIVKQRRVADTTSAHPAPIAPRGTLRLHPDDRERIGDAREAATDFARTIRNFSGATEDNTEALNRRGGRR